jgi:type I restriction enzyme M protein
MIEKDEGFVYKLTDLLRGHFKPGEIMKINIGMTFIQWALKQKNIKAHCHDDLSICSKEAFGDQLRNIAICIEEQYPFLKGVLLTFLPSRLSQDMSDLQSIVEAFILPEWDEYTAEELVSLFNNLVMEADGQEEIYSTPESIRALMVKLIIPQKDMKVADLFSGVGSCLAEVNAAYKDLNPVLYGEEINFDMYGISNMLLLINGINNAKIVHRNVYNTPEVDWEKFDNIFMDAPFALNVSIEEGHVYKYGLPSKSSADWANYQIAVYKLNRTGRAVATISVGGLNRSSDLRIREGIITDDLIEAVIMLPSSMYAHTAIPTALLVFNKRKPEERKNKILMIDASERFVKRNRKQNELDHATILQIASITKKWEEIERFSTIVDKDTLAMNEYNLNASFYLNAKVIEEKLGNSIMLKEVADILPGVQVTAGDLEILKRNATHYFLNVKNIQDDEIVYDEDERIRDKKVNWYGKYDIQAGDIIMTTKGTTAKAVIVPDNFNPAFIANNLTIIRVNHQRYSPYVLLKYLKSELGRLVLESVSTGASIRIINASKLGNIEVPNYDFEKCLQIGERIKANNLEYRQRIETAKRKFEMEEREINKELGF